LLKGGTTVSAIAEELVEIPLRICGRISKRGTVSSQIMSVKHPHSILLEKGCDTIALSCTGMSTIGLYQEIKQSIVIRIVDPVLAAGTLIAYLQL